jgi:ribosomal protein L11 methyltransferase
MPIWIGDGLILASPADAEYIRRDPRAVVMDAGQAFGTGTHPTTHMCLVELPAHLQVGGRVLDVGTGSGILAIAAARLGAGRVLAIDKSFSACRVAEANVGRNGLHRMVSVVAGTPEVVGCRARFDLILANLDPAVVMMQWLPTISRLCRAGGRIILSGIPSPGEELLQPALGVATATQIARRTREGWITLVLRKQG